MLWFHFSIYQYALIEIPVAVLQADSYDAGVLRLSVMREGVTWRAGAQRCEGYGASVCGEGGAGQGRGHRGHGGAGCGRAGVHGVERGAGGRLRELQQAEKELLHTVTHRGGRQKKYKY